MKNHIAARIALAVMFLSATPGMLLLTGCIGTAGASSVTFSISPSPATFPVGSPPQQFYVYENGEAITAGITWEVNSIVGGDTTIGTISSTGLYTPPQTVPSPAIVAVSATEPGLSESLVSQVTITGPSTPPPAPTANISVSPSVITAPGTATLTWSCSNSTSATINQSSVLDGFTIGISGSIPVSPTVTTPYQLNCNGTNGSASMTATLTVQSSIASPVTVSITPTSGTFASNTTIPFAAVVTNDPLNKGVQWTSSLGAPPVPTGPLAANYLTPSVTVAQGINVIATSVADPNASATATIIVNPAGNGGGSGGGGGSCTSAPASANPPQAAISPPLIEMIPGATQTFDASLTGDNVTSQAFLWSIKTTQSVSDLGTITLISSDGHEVTYQAPVTGLPLLVVQLVATSQEYTCISGDATVQVAPKQ